MVAGAVPVACAVALLLCACGASSSAVHLDTAQTTEVGAAPAPFSAAGDYALVGAPRADGCGGAIHLAARNIQVSEHVLFADVVDRRYSRAQTSDPSVLVYEGRFPADNVCDESTLFERWTLRPSSDGGLEGELSSTWLIPTDCAHPCTIHFAIEARRATHQAR